MANKSSHEDVFVENFLQGFWLLTCKDYFDPIYHEEVVAFLETPAADILSYGAADKIRELLESGVVPQYQNRNVNGRRWQNAKD